MAMRLITRSDFDGLECGTLLLEAGVIDHWKFVHPKDLQDGLIEIDENDCLANVPFVEAADSGLIIIPVNLSVMSWRASIRAKAVSHLPAQGLFTSITVARSVSPTLTI